MSEHTEDPVGQASSKIVQYVSLATVAAETLAQVRQQRAAAAAAMGQQTAAVLRAQHRAAHAAARLQWAPVLDPLLRDRSGVVDAGLAWAVAYGWRDVDPEAALATERATDRLRALRPDVMARYDRLTADGLDPVEAMRQVAPLFDRPPAHAGHGPARQALDTQTSTSRQHYIDTGQYLSEPIAARPPAASPTVTAHAEAPLAEVAGPSHLDGSRSVVPTVDDAADLADAARVPVRRSATTPRSAPELARDAFPENLTGQVLAAGRVKPKNPATSAPAAVRSSTLATAARASNRGR